MLNAQRLADLLAGSDLSLDQIRDEIDRVLTKIPDQKLEKLVYDWSNFWARENQLPPDNPLHRCKGVDGKWCNANGPDTTWRTWLLMPGRGFGKTRTGAETVHEWAFRSRWARIGLVGATVGDVNGTMVEGESGIMSFARPWFMPDYQPSKRRIIWPNGARAYLYSAEEPARLRGPNLTDAWIDELCAWSKDEAWKQLKLCLRKKVAGRTPRLVITTTPKPTELLLELVDKPHRLHVTCGSTFENAANLDEEAVAEMVHLFGGTRLGRQELFGEILRDAAGSLFPRSFWERKGVRLDAAPHMVRVVVAVDPAPTSNEGSDFTGIVAAGLGEDGHVYLLRDRSCKGSPDEWARAAIVGFHTHKAECLAAEVNAGGEMVAYTINTVDGNIPVKEVRAMRGKAKRAEPVAAFFEQGKIHLVGSREDWATFVDQASRFTGENGKRDDRVDAMIWAVHELVISANPFLFS